MSRLFSFVQRESTVKLALNVEKILDVWPELSSIAQDHADEVEKMPIPLDPDVEKYDLLEKVGMFYLYVLRDEGAIVGYFSVVVQPSLHYRNKIQAYFDAVYLKPGYRNKATVKIIKAVEDSLLCKGASYFAFSMKADRPARRLMRILGYEHTEDVFLKVVEPQWQD